MDHYEQLKRNIPYEMRNYNQWVLVDHDTKVPLCISEGKIGGVSVHDKNSFHSLSDALQLSEMYSKGIGFVITEDDPFVCIDLDVKDRLSLKKDGTPFKNHEWTTIHVLDSFTKALEQNNSYSEMSVSGKGVHIWVKGSLSKNYKISSHFMEIYDHERMIIFTGLSIDRITYRIEDDIAIPSYREGVLSLEHRQDILDSLEKSLSQLSPASGNSIFDVESFLSSVSNEVQKHTDPEIINKLKVRADLGEVYDLYINGHNSIHMAKFSNDRSRADQKLLDVIDNYTQCFQQTLRIFKASACYRESKKGNYIERTVCNIRQHQSNKLSYHISNEQMETMCRELAHNAAQQNIARRELQNKRLEALRNSKSNTVSTLPSSDIIYSFSENLVYPTEGLLPDLARVFYNDSFVKDEDLSLIAALAYMAGIFGGYFNTPTACGINCYFMVAAGTGQGKQMLSEGPMALNRALEAKSFPNTSKRLNDSEVSGVIGLRHHFDNNPDVISYLHIMSECSHLLAAQQKLDVEGIRGGAKDVTNEILKWFKAFDYSNGGIGAYRKSKDSGLPLGRRSYSFIGEAQPERLLTQLNANVLSNGFMSRLIFYVKPKRETPLTMDELRAEIRGNTGRDLALYEKVTNHIMALVSHYDSVFSINNIHHNPITMFMDKEAADYSQELQILCRYQMEILEENEFQSLGLSIWNRAHEKALRLATLHAISMHIVRDSGLRHKPLVGKDDLEWAWSIIMSCARTIYTAVDAGRTSVGSNDISKLVLDKIQHLLTNKKGVAVHYAKLMDAGYLPYVVLKNRIASTLTRRMTAMGMRNINVDKELMSAIKILCAVKELEYMDSVYEEGLTYSKPVIRLNLE